MFTIFRGQFLNTDFNRKGTNNISSNQRNAFFFLKVRWYLIALHMELNYKNKLLAEKSYNTLKYIDT